ncbi:PAS domain-containing protein [Tropicimonas sp. IMCC6043]|uniref:PAS domain-containing protein n=1 Tax=Tropicimonas sp. IMCC6043 TaxID=2510645 RepID=UPI00101BDC4B|nr:PAS domain-containing protein [Tropicimonas sp. IMCC6043]RYH12053.1 PAS domain-containing protein [Tropicimonas sp. IMCC6043]
MSDEFVDSRKVVSLRDAGGATMRFPILQTVESYWDSLRGGRPMPDRAELDPRRIQTALAHAFILERLAPGVARFRLAGSHLNDLMGMEVRGMPLTSFFLPDARKRVSQSLVHVFDEPAKAWLTLSGDRGIGKPPLDACLLILPLRADSGEVSRALGCLATLGPVGRAPRRFDIRSTAVTPILPDGSLQVPETAPDEWPERPAGVFREVTGLAEPAHGYRPSPHRPPRTDRPQLYLVKSDA